LNTGTPPDPTPAQIATAVERWIGDVIVSLNLCPFAGRVFREERIRITVTDTASESMLLDELARQMDALREVPDVATSLLVHPEVLTDFAAYNQFLDQVDALLQQQGYEGEFQVASFHPDYQFAGTRPADAENYSSRSPYPLLHILRESSIDEAIERYADVDGIPARNIETLNALGERKLQALWQACFRVDD
jgi:hypothetical protein